MNRVKVRLRAIISGSATLAVSASVIALGSAGTASAATLDQQADTQPPSVPAMGSIELDTCGLFFNLLGRPSTDNVSPQSKLTYEVFYNGQYRTTWGANLFDPSIIRIAVPGVPGVFAVRAVDEAGNRSALSAGLILS